MLYPAMSELLKNVDSRYLLVNVVAHRARQLSIESELTHEQLACAGSFECRNQLIFTKFAVNPYFPANFERKSDL